MATFVEANHKQLLLLPPDLRDWIPKDDISHFILQAVERVDISAFKINHRGSGSPRYHPRLMLSLLIYCYAHGIFSSRRIERATYRDLGARFITANTHPDHDTICSFRRQNEEAFAKTFLEVLKMAMELKLLRVGTVSVDGTKIDANASIYKSVRYDRAKALEKQLRKEVRERMKEAERADASNRPDPDALPADLANRERLAKKLAEAQERIKARAKARAEKEKTEHEKRLKNRKKRKGRRSGRKPGPPDPKPRPEEQSNLTDPDSRIMRKNHRAECRQSYNAQAVVETQSMLVLGARVSNCANDTNELVADVESIPSDLGLPKTVLADTGYMNGKEVRALQEQGIKVVMATKAPRRRKHDFRPEKPKKNKKLQARKPWILEIRKEMDKKENQDLYSLRKQTVEPVFGIVKRVMGFRQFLLRGIKKVELESGLSKIAFPN